MKRHTITEGAKTTAGGRVLQASSRGSINGARIALEKDAIFCPACKSAGHILCIGPRLEELWSGKQVALENDLCICSCYPHPRLIANQNMRYQIVDPPPAARSQILPCDAGSLATNPTSNLNVSVESYDLHFHVTEEIDGKPLADYLYVIELANGERSEGKIDQDGNTGTITAAQAQYASLIVYAPGTTPINPN